MSTPASAREAALTAGQMIRAARLHKGMHLAVLSVNLKVPVRQLEALEADQHDTSKGPVFVRALASSVCRQLQIDPAPVLAVLPQSMDRLPLARQPLESLHADKRLVLDKLSVVRLIPHQTVVIAAVMLAMIAALLWMPSPWSWFQSEPPTPAQAPAPAAELAPTVTEAAAAEVQKAQAQANEVHLADTAVIASSSATATLQPSVPEATTGVTPATVPMSAPAASTTPVANKAAAVGSAAGGAVLGFEASNDSWIEIRDGKNQVLWTRVVRAGESVQVQYPLPMNVVIGKARAVSVTYKGKPFDLAPHTKVTVARFEVKE